MDELGFILMKNDVQNAKSTYRFDPVLDRIDLMRGDLESIMTRVSTSPSKLRKRKD